MDVHLLDRGTMAIDLNYAIEGAVTATDSNPNPDAVRADGPVFNLVIDHPDATVLWDTGSHPDAGSGHWPAETYDAFTHADASERDLPTALGERGFAIEDIDAVVQSHLHLDHAGGLHHFAGSEVPIYVHEQELKHAYFGATTGVDGAYILDDFHHELAWEPLYGEGGYLFDGIDWLHLPGHTPGHTGLLVERDGAEDLLVVGDLAYSSVNYEHEQPMGRDLLHSRGDWWASLRRCQEVENRRDVEVIYGHDPEQVASFGERL